MIPATPIITISLGEERTFRLRSWPAKPGAKFIDSPAKNGTVFVMPWETNRVFTHEVPASTRNRGRQISITLRAFANDQT
jgi:alkylated DNA repair dioxygenase AlkB